MVEKQYNISLSECIKAYPVHVDTMFFMKQIVAVTGSIASDKAN